LNEQFFLAFFTDGDHFDDAKDFDDVGGFRSDVLVMSYRIRYWFCLPQRNSQVAV
jgi:hypothetical protein